MASCATCSAPGKVLLAGGYLILDRPHAGSVLALDARFYSQVEICTFADAEETAEPGELLLEVHSPQFCDVRRYLYKPSAPTPLMVLCWPNNAEPPSNRYVEVPLLYGLTLIRGACGASFFEAALATARSSGWTGETKGVVGVRVTIAADNGFYSQAAELRARGLPLTAASLRSLPPMLPPRCEEGEELAKTGLGSSATLVTSLLGALLQLFGIVQLPARGDDSADASSAIPADERSLRLLHNLSQLCHCAAQGKVGSGFDVCTATYGSQRYVRFSPSIIAPLLALAPGVAPSASALERCVGVTAAETASTEASNGWDHIVTPFQLPPGVEVMMADVSCGANTPSMVRKVLKWRAEGSGVRACRHRLSHAQAVHETQMLWAWACAWACCAGVPVHAPLIVWCCLVVAPSLGPRVHA